MRSDGIIGLLERKHIVELLNRGQRRDERGFTDLRDVKIVPNVIKKAEGSAMVNLGGTIVVAGVKAQLGAPFPDTPNDGVLIVNLEMSPIASPVFESGPPSSIAIEISRVVDRGIRESKVVTMKDPRMCVQPGKNVWLLFVDIYLINDNGNLIDASSLAAMAALLATKLPTVTINPESEEVEVNKEVTTSLPFHGVVASMTFAKIDKYIISDPILIEDGSKEARFTVSIKSDGMICSMQKGEAGVFSKDEIFSMLDEAADKIKIYHQALEQLDTTSEVKEMFNFN